MYVAQTSIPLLAAWYLTFETNSSCSPCLKPLLLPEKFILTALAVCISHFTAVSTDLGTNDKTQALLQVKIVSFTYSNFCAPGNLYQQ